MRIDLKAAVTSFTVLCFSGVEVAQAATTCKIDTSKTGVLVGGEVSGGFPCYIKYLLQENVPFVMLLAIILVVASGVQYMLAQGVPGEQAKAKQRILGIIGGILFYFLIQYLLPLIAGNISL